MEIPRAVVFDLGKVLLDFDYGRAARNLLAHCSVSEEELAGLLNQSSLLHRYETGLISSREFFEEVQRGSQFCRGFDDFEPLFADIFAEIPEMIALNERLREQGVPTYIFSNTNEIAVRHIRQRYPFFENFTGYIYSFEHGAMKPDPTVYEVVEKRTSHSGQRLLYIDDRAENVERALERGWRAILHRHPSETIPQVEELLLNSSPG